MKCAKGDAKAAKVERGTVMIAAGGTGGHIFPGIALAQSLQSLADVEIVFAGTHRGIERDVVPKHRFAIEYFDVDPIVGGGVGRVVNGAASAARATVDAIARLRKIAPRIVISIGGYAAGPVSLAASMLGIPVVLVEPNSIAGLANRLIGHFAKRAFVAWPETGTIFSAARVRVVGVPLRSDFVRSPYVPSARKRVLVMGGSQGAGALNERLPQAIRRLLDGGIEVEVVHQAGRGAEEAVSLAYARERISSVTVVPFLEDVAGEIARADVVVARAGAVTVAEIAAIGRASILVPFPKAAADHQAKNAMALSALGASVCVRQEAADASRLTMELRRLLTDDALVASMARAAAEHGAPDAALRVAREVLEIAQIEAIPWADRETRQAIAKQAARLRTDLN